MCLILKNGEAGERDKVRALKKLLSLPPTNKHFWDIVDSEAQVSLFVYDLDFVFTCVNDLAGLGSTFNVTYPANLAQVSKENFVEIAITKLPDEILAWLL